MNRFAILPIVILAMLLAYSYEMSAQQKRAFLVGISDYGNEEKNPNEFLNIHGANDVKLLMPKLKQQGFTITSLVNNEATYSNIIKGFNQLTKSCNAGDIVYIHFSMHGQPIEDKNGDEKDGWDEALIPIDAKMRYKKGIYEGDKHLIDDKLGELVSNLRSKIGSSGMLYVVIDACHSGEASRGDDDEYVRGTIRGFSPSGKDYNPIEDNVSNDYFKITTTIGQSPVMFIEACRSYEQNKEIKDTQTNTWYGPLSYYIYQAMNTHEIGKSLDWVNEVKNSMKSYRGHHQNMVIESSK